MRLANAGFKTMILHIRYWIKGSKMKKIKNEVATRSRIGKVHFRIGWSVSKAPTVSEGGLVSSTVAEQVEVSQWANPKQKGAAIEKAAPSTF